MKKQETQVPIFRRMLAQPAPKGSEVAKPQDDGEESFTQQQWLAHVMRQTPSLTRRLLRQGKGGRIQSPESMNVVLRYGERITMTCTLGATTYYQFRADCYDPNVNIAGGQPVGFDQWMAFYKNYQVNRFRFRMKAAAADESNPSRVGVLGSCCLPSGGLSGSETLAAISVMPWGRTDMFNGIGSPPISVDSEWIEVRDVLGLTKEEFEANVDTWGTSSAVAVYTAYWAMAWENINASAVTTVLYGMVDLEMDVKFFNRAKLIIS